MPDLGKYFVGSLQDLARSTGLRLYSTWAGWSLDTIYTSHKGLVPCRLQDRRLKVTLRTNPCIEGVEDSDGSRRPSWRALVFVLEVIYNCQGLSSSSLKYVNPNTAILGSDSS